MLSSLAISPTGAVGLNEFQSPFPPLVGCTPHAQLDRAVPLGIGEAASSKRLSGQRPSDRSGLAKDRSKQTASVSVCKGSVK